jgi:hypothetical protein
LAWDINDITSNVTYIYNYIYTHIYYIYIHICHIHIYIYTYTVIIYIYIYIIGFVHKWVRAVKDELSCGNMMTETIAFWGTLTGEGKFHL